MRLLIVAIVCVLLGIASSVAWWMLILSRVAVVCR